MKESFENHKIIFKYKKVVKVLVLKLKIVCVCVYMHECVPVVEVLHNIWKAVPSFYIVEAWSLLLILPCCDL